MAGWRRRSLPREFPLLAPFDLEDDQAHNYAKPEGDQRNGEHLAGQPTDQGGAEPTGDNKRRGRLGLVRRSAQPYRLEGFRFGPVVAPPDALPVTPLGDAPEGLVERRVATCAVPAHAQRCERDLAEVAQSDVLDDDVGQKVD